MLNPLELAPAQLRQLSPETLDRYARGATGKMARLRVFLGQVLLAMDDTDAHDHFGCHSSAHYAEAILRMDGKSAQRLRRIAIRLETLPVLSEAVANGTIAWSSLRAILPLCDEGNEAEWLRRAQQLTSRELEAAIRFQRSGGASADPRQAVELTFHVSPETAALLEWANRDLSREAGRRVNAEELLEALCAERLAGAPFPSEAAWNQVQVEAARDVEAAAARSVEVAVRSGLVELPDEEASPEASVDEVPLNHWNAVIAQETPCPGAPRLTLVRPTPTWQNDKLRFNPKSRLVTDAQRREIFRRDAYGCSTPGCTHTLWLHVHHIVFFSEGGLTVPDNLLTVCSACHRALHEGHLQVREGPRGLIWRDGANRLLVPFRSQATPAWLTHWFAESLRAG